MNERWKELLLTAGYSLEEGFQKEMSSRELFETFAELIVKECIRTIQIKIPREGKTPENLRSYQHVRDIATTFDIQLPLGYNEVEVYTYECPKCGEDRGKVPCPNNHYQCPMVGVAQ